ncbi:MAG: hypothetical protein IH991_10350 [Planctomycetes bacterium]|nr:hypothetical protein [Planctomycetota bacterium]
MRLRLRTSFCVMAAALVFAATGRQASAQGLSGLFNNIQKAVENFQNGDVTGGLQNIEKVIAGGGNAPPAPGEIDPGYVDPGFDEPVFEDPTDFPGGEAIELDPGFVDADPSDEDLTDAFPADSPFEEEAIPVFGEAEDVANAQPIFAIVDPRSGQSLDPTRKMRLVTGELVTAGEYYSRLDKVERLLSELGYTLQDAENPGKLNYDALRRMISPKE